MAANKGSKKILLIESDPQLVDMMKYPLQEEGYAVLWAKDGPEGLKATVKTQPDLVIMDFALPSMKGNSLARRIRKDPVTNHIRIIMIADENQLEDLEIGPRSAVDDFFIKPFGTVELVTKVKPFLVSDEDLEGSMISTGNGELDQKMGGGIPIKTLTLIEGDSGAGKSVLSQQMMRGCLSDGYRVTLFSSENTVKSLVKQMRSLNLDIIDALLLDKMRVFPIETARLGKDASSTLLQAIKREKGRDMIFVDSLTTSISSCSDTEVLAFFESSKRLCADGTTVVIVVHSHGLTRELLTRIRSLCDAHLQLRTEEVGNKLVKTLEVTKVRGAEQSTGNIVSFEVEPGWGMRIIPVSKVRG
ncbi:MAG: response regulator [Deltaproteobacteria bacterium]|nr:response regulator [Deltaproteobacteria bacterium]